MKIFCTVLLYILASSSEYLQLLLGPYHSVLYYAHLCMKCSLGISNFLEEIFSLSHSIVTLITEEAFLSPPCCSLEHCIQMGVSFLFSFALYLGVCTFWPLHIFLLLLKLLPLTTCLFPISMSFYFFRFHIEVNVLQGYVPFYTHTDTYLTFPLSIHPLMDSCIFSMLVCCK